MAASGWQNLRWSEASKIKGRSLMLRTYIIPREQQADQPSRVASTDTWKACCPEVTLPYRVHLEWYITR